MYLYKNARTVPFPDWYHGLMRAASYSRRSNARGKRSDQRSVEEQDELNLRVAQRNNWDLPTSRMFRDNDISASRYSSKERPDWERLCKTLDNGEVDLLILYESSRAQRDFYEWVPIVKLCEHNKILIHVTSDNRTYDPNNDRDWEALLEDGIDSEKESRKLSKRVRRAMDANKEQGRPHSTPAYGYRIEIDPADHRTKVRVPVPEQVAIVREVITRVAQSDPITAIARDLNERGIPSPSVALGLKTPRSNSTPLWSPAMIRKICTNVVYIGQREYKEGSRTIRVAGSWEAVIDEELFWKARNLLQDPTRKTTKPGRNKYLLNFLGTCSECGSFLARRGGSNPDRYRCNGKGCSTIRMDWVDLFIGELVCQRLSRKDIYELLTAKPETSDLSVELEKLRADYQEALDLRAEGKLSIRALSLEEERLLPRIAELERALRPVSIPVALESLTRDAEGNLQVIRTRWKALDIPAQRDVLRTVFEYITIKPTQTPGQHKTPEQIQRMLRERVSYKWVNAS